MKPRLKSTRAARDLIRAHEPFHGEAVRRGKRWVVGYGHTAAAKPGVTLSREDAELLLIYDVLQAETAVHASLGEDIADPVRDALVSFAASVGVNAFKVSDVARLAKAGKLEAAANALESWVRAEEDGRLVTSRALQDRRAAEKALMLGAAPAADLDPELEPEPEVAPEVEPEPQAEPARGPLIDVDIAFEEPEEVAPAAPEPAEDAAQVAPEPEPASEADPEAPAEPEAEALAEDAAPEPDTPAETHDAEAAAPAEDQAEPDAEAAVKASQDAAIKAVMSRMAGEIAQSVSVAGVRRPAETSEPAAPADEPEDAAEPEAEARSQPAPQRDYAEVQLGYSFLLPAVVGVSYDEPEPVAEPEPEPVEDEAPGPVETAAEETAPEDVSAAQVAGPEDASGEAAGPGRAVASPAPGPVYASVSVGPIEKSETAPPHPAEAPAPADGMSGESEGPDHAEDGEHEEPGEDEAELEPAIVAGPEAIYVADETPPGAVEGRGDWVHAANMITGAALTGVGGWQIAANLDAYLATGLGYNWIPPGLFAGGVLLLVSSGWVVVGKMTSKKKG
ncbi:MAG: glycoside hydrolase family protein [Oceanicaulis sp.]